MLNFEENEPDNYGLSLILGTKEFSLEDIANIDKNVLYTCYNTFYHPSNMTMVLCGDFEPEQIICEVEKRLVKKENQGEIKRIYPDEPHEIVNNYKEEKMEISTPLFVIGIKDEVTKEMVKKHIAIEIILKMLLGKSSTLYNELYNEDLVQGDIDASYEFTKNYAHVLIQGQSKAPEILQNKLNDEIEKIKKIGFSNSDYSRARKSLYASYIKEYNSIEEISTMFLSDSMKEISSFDYLEEFNTVTKEYAEQVINDVFSSEYMVLSVIRK